MLLNPSVAQQGGKASALQELPEPLSQQEGSCSSREPGAKGCSTRFWGRAQIPGGNVDRAILMHCSCCACKHMVRDLQKNSATLDWIRVSPVLNSSLVQSNQFTPMLVCARFFSSGYPDKSKQRRSLHFHCLSEMYLILLYIPFLGRVICLKKKEKRKEKTEKIWKRKTKNKCVVKKSSVTLD